MAEAVNFDGANVTLRRPQDMTEEECGDARAYTDGSMVVTAWRLNPMELHRIIETGVIWLTVHGRAMPPIAVAADPPIKVDGEDPKILTPGPKIDG